MFDTSNHSLAMPFLVPPSKPRRSVFTESRIVDNPAAVRRELKRLEQAEQRAENKAAATVVTPAIGR
jgi:hypothetical protein